MHRNEWTRQYRYTVPTGTVLTREKVVKRLHKVHRWRMDPPPVSE